MSFNSVISTLVAKMLRSVKVVLDKSIESIISATGISDTNAEDKKKKYDELLKQFSNTDFGKYKM